MRNIASAGACLLTLTAIAAGWSAASPEGGSARAGGTGVPAKAAHAFTESIGVNTHTYYTGTVYYRRFALIERRLRQLGIRHIRENLMPDRPDQYRRLRQLAALGIKSTLILGNPGNGRAGLRRLVAILARRLVGGTDAAEGPNEFDLSGSRNWAPRLARYQAALYRAVKSNPRLSRLPVVGPSMGGFDNQGQLGDISEHLDFGNIHTYPDGEPPEANLAEWLTAAHQNSGFKPVLATETGYQNAIRARVGQRPISEAGAAIYMPRLYLDYFAQGVVRTFPYELVDEFRDPGREEPESNFGLLRHNLSPKPAFRAIRNLIAILADPGPTFAPGGLDYSLGGDLSDLDQVLMEKRDGRFYLALWRTTSVWNPDDRSALHPEAAPVELNFGSEPRRVRKFVPNASSDPVGTLTTNAGATSVEVGPRIVIVEVQPPR
jgi:hypothetical protein